MPLYRIQVETRRGADVAIDHVVNTFYLQDIGPTSDPQNLADDAAQLWVDFRNYPNGITSCNTKVYDMDQPEPRVPVAESGRLVTSSGQESAPREVALCLSFFATNNVPRRRGRLYIGPWPVGQVFQERPGASITGVLETLANGLANLGGVDVDWMQYSPTNNLANKVTNWWVDNEWDTVRSRGLKATTRISGTTGE